MPYAVWRRLEAAAPDVELVPVEGWIEADREIKEPAELERVAASCAVADRALAALLPSIRPGATERQLALDLEWRMRTGGADAIAFDADLPRRPERGPAARVALATAVVQAGQVVLFDFGAEVDGYRSDMTRTLFVGEPAERDLAVYELVAKAQAAVIRQIDGDGRRRAGRSRRGGRCMTSPTG